MKTQEKVYKTSEKGIGDILFKLRTEGGYTQAQVCHGICSVKEYGRIEANDRLPGHFELDLFFARLGKSTEHLEYVLSREIYDLYEIQYLIQTAICHREFEKAEELLGKYERMKLADKPIHRQYIAQERAQIAWLLGGKVSTVRKYLEEAIKETLSEEILLEMKAAISAEELKLLLFKHEISEIEKSEKLHQLKTFIQYIDSHIKDMNEKVKVYPYAVLLYSEYAVLEKEYNHLLYLLETSFELLRDTGKILYLPEIMQEYAELLEYSHSSTERIETIRRERNTLLELERECDIHLEKYRLFQHLNREFELDYEWLRRWRMAKGLSQEELCDGICAQETLSRIESGKRTPNRKILNQLLERLGRPRSAVETVVFAEDYETIELKREYEYRIYRFEKERVDEFLEQLQSKRSEDCMNNENYIIAAEIKRNYEDGKLSSEIAIEKLYALIKKEIPLNVSIYDCKLTSTEIHILNQIAILYHSKNEKEKAIEIHRLLLENYEKEYMLPIFHARQWILQLSNIATNLEECDCLEEALRISEMKMRKVFELGKLTEIGRSMSVISCVLEKRGNMEYKRYVNRALDMFDLVKNKHWYRATKAYIQQMS